MNQPHFFETRAHVLFCTGPSCVQRGARTVFDSFWNAMERERLAYYSGGTTRLTESGCLGGCSYGPNLCIYARTPNGSLEEAWYHEQTVDSALEIARAIQRGEALPTTRRYG